MKILLAGILRKVADADGVLLPSAVHGFSHGLAAAGARAHGRRDVAALAARAIRAALAGGLGVAKPEGVHRREILVRALGGPVVPLLAADAADEQRGVAAGHLGELVALLLALRLGRGAVALQEDLFDGNRRHGLVAGLVPLRVAELGPVFPFRHRGGHLLRLDVHAHLLHRSHLDMGGR